tara:strand:- start:41 stop:205 length:165 start_codon:yes stop_codon:yes gene_type:complete
MRNTKAIHLIALIDEVEILKTMLRPEDTGHIHTTISMLENRISSLIKELGGVFK